MAFLEVKNVRIAGISACVPPRVEENIDLPVFIPGEAEKVIELGKNKFPSNKSFKLKQPIPYIDSSIYHNQRVFGFVGMSVNITNWYVNCVTPMVVVSVNGSWGSCSVKLEDFEKCIEYEHVQRNY
jgi:hypothetical protein